MASSRIHLLGEIGIGVARAYARMPDPPDVTSTAQLWDSEVQRLMRQADVAEWDPLWFETLATTPELLEDESAELRFASRLAFFLESLPEGSDVEQSALSLLDVSAYAPEDLAPEVANESLRLVEASAPIVAATPEGQAMLRSQRLPSALESLRLDDDLHRRVDMTAATLDRAAAASGVHAKPLRVTFDLDERHPRGETFVNVGVDDVKAPGAGPSIDRVAPTEEILVWVELGPRNPEAAAGDTEPVDPAALVDGQELEVVVFPDATLAVTPTAGRVRIASSGAFPVVRRATATLGDATADEQLLGSRLYFRVVLPREPGAPRLRVAVYLKGVLVHVEQLTLPVGLDRKPTVRTMHRLARTFEAADRFESLRSPTLSIYSNAGEATHDFSFYLPGRTEAEAGIPSELHLDSNEVVAAIDNARRTLRQIAWGDPEELDGQRSLFPSDGKGRFGNATSVTRALVDLAVVGHSLWGYLSAELERTPDFRDRLQKAMRPPGAVQLSTTDHPNQILPLQVLYDRNLNTAAASTYLKLCSATAAWLEDPSDEDPPCLVASCPDEDSTEHVCVAAFWGIRHGVSINPAHRSGELRSTVESGAKPVATLATTTDSNVQPYWDDHEAALKEILDVPTITAITAPPIFKSLKDDRSVLLYFLAHVDCKPQHPRIWMSNAPDGAIDWSTLNAAHPALQEHEPVVFINACGSAAMSPERVLSLIAEFFLYGAGGAVGTEITVFVDFATVFADSALRCYASGETLSQSLRRARIEGLRRMNPMGFAYLGFGLHDLRLARHPARPEDPRLSLRVDEKGVAETTWADVEAMFPVGV